MEVQPLQFGTITIGLLGGLAIFLFGMGQMTDAMKVVAGARMKQVLERLTTNRFKAVLAGAFVTGTIQSSSVTTVLLVGFVSAGLMNFQQTIGVIMGAEIGTTVTAQIIAFKVTRLAIVAIIVGVAANLLGKSTRTKQLGLMVLGLGLVFYGMNMMGDATSPLRTHQPFIDLMQSMENPLFAILLSASFTAAVQSSSATTGLIIVLASQGFITLEAGIPLVFGANIGTCITALLASIGKPRDAVRTALVHVTFNVAGVLVWFGFVDELASVVRFISPTAEGLTGAARLAAETPRQIANAHTTFNVANTLLFIGLIPVIAWWVKKLVPDAPSEPEGIAKLKYLDDLLLETPSLALDRVRLELGRVSERVLEMVRATPPAFIERSDADLARIRAMDDDVDSIHRAVIAYMARLSQVPMGDQETRLLHSYIAVANYLEAIADVVETNLVHVAETAAKHRVVMSDETRRLLHALYERVHWSVETAAEAVYAADPVRASAVIDAKETVTDLVDHAEDHLATRLAADDPNRLDTFRVESSLVESLKRIYYFAKRIAKEIAIETEPAAWSDQEPAGDEAMAGAGS